MERPRLTNAALVSGEANAINQRLTRWPFNTGVRLALYRWRRPR